MMIEIVLAFVDDQGKAYYQTLAVPKNTTICEALKLSGWLQLPEFLFLKQWLEQVGEDTSPNHKCWHIGIFSQKKSLGTLLQDGDRIEIYRPLISDAMGTRHKKVYKTQKDTAKAVQLRNLNKKLPKENAY